MNTEIKLKILSLDQVLRKMTEENLIFILPNVAFAKNKKFFLPKKLYKLYLTLFKNNREGTSQITCGAFIAELFLQRWQIMIKHLSILFCYGRKLHE